MFGCGDLFVVLGVFTCVVVWLELTLCSLMLLRGCWVGWVGCYSGGCLGWVRGFLVVLRVCCLC